MNALALVLTAALPVASGFTFPPQYTGGVVATLTVQVAEQGPAPGRARGKLTLNVTGPATLEVSEPHLEDALAGWTVETAFSSWSLSDETAEWEQTLHLVQVKPGVVPLPGVTLRVRAHARAGWEEASWPDLLLEPRDPPGPVPWPPLPPSPWPAFLLRGGVALALGLALAFLVRIGKQWVRRGRGSVSLHEQTLSLLDQTPTEPVAAVRHVDAVLRGYLARRFGVETLHRTNPELFAALSLPHEQQAALNGVLSLCDLLKFAGMEDPHGARLAVEQAKQFVQATARAGESAGNGEGTPGRENRGNVQGG